MAIRTSGSITYADWRETPAGPEGTYPRLGRASVVNHYAGGIEAASTTCEYALAYTTEKTGTCTGMELLAGRLDGRAGSFVIEQQATFGEDGSVRATFTVVPGSGTGELAGLRGEGEFSYRPGQSPFPYSFDYQLD
ncbi:DUF3224 domain-containing protein [Streptomyces sp. NPDC046887]|uniref:DUF3224 domain-containing protein n=1 Tax=Streptomyces sp. NPDC046887 TaxID=3155472 RepID=UPI0033EF49ED